MSSRGLFITFEGLDGSGKSTQLGMLAERLRALGRDVVTTQEPGGTAVGDRIRAVLLDPASESLRPTAELLLMFASRAQNVDERILPALREGKIVLCDRFTDSTLAYQGAARGLGAEVVYDVDRIACRGLVPDLTLLIDLDAAAAFERARARNAGMSEGSRPETRIDEQDVSFHRQVRDAYLQAASDEGGRIHVVDGSQDLTIVGQEIWRIVDPLVNRPA